MRLQDYFDEIYRPLRLRGRSWNTSRLYACTIRAFERFLMRPATIDDLDELTLARFLEHRAIKHSPYTVEKERSQLVSLARLGHSRGLLAALPSCVPGPLPDRVPVSWSEDELRRLFVAARSLSGFIGTIRESVYWPILLSVAFESGERIGAIMAVPRRCYQRPTITFDPGIRKGGRRGRVCYLTDDVCDQIDDMLRIVSAAASEPLFPWPKAKTYLWDRFKELLRRANLSGRRGAFQQLRRSAISMIARAGADPVAFAGHSQSATTRRWYIDPRYTDTGPRPCDLLPKIGRRSEN